MSRQELGAFLIAGECEELGWSGFAADRLQMRSSALATSVTIGLVWAIWHVIPLMQAHRSPIWIACWALGTVASRVLIVWRYNNTNGSVFAASLCHAVDNVSWLMFPNGGSNYDARITGPITAVAAVIVTTVWGRRRSLGVAPSRPDRCVRCKASTGGRCMDDDLTTMSREALIAEVRKLRDGIRAHRDTTGQELCWHHPKLWGLLPERTDPVPIVPTWPEFLRGCVRYRQSLDDEAPDAPRSSAPYDSRG